MLLPTIHDARVSEADNAIIGYIAGTSVRSSPRIYARINGDTGYSGWSLFVGLGDIVVSDYDVNLDQAYRIHSS